MTSALVILAAALAPGTIFGLLYLVAWAGAGAGDRSASGPLALYMLLMQGAQLLILWPLSWIGIDTSRLTHFADGGMMPGPTLAGWVILSLAAGSLAAAVLALRAWAGR